VQQTRTARSSALNSATAAAPLALGRDTTLPSSCRPESSVSTCSTSPSLCAWNEIAVLGRASAPNAGPEGNEFATLCCIAAESDALAPVPPGAGAEGLVAARWRPERLRCALRYASVALGMRQ
jgi:hypothetical protein